MSSSTVSKQEVQMDTFYSDFPYYLVHTPRTMHQALLHLLIHVSLFNSKEIICLDLYFKQQRANCVKSLILLTLEFLNFT